MAERIKSFIPIIANKDRILGTEIPQKEGQTFLTKDGKFSYFDKGGERFLSPKFGVIEKDPGNEFGVFLRDYASFKGSLIISRDQNDYKMFYVDTNGAVYSLSGGGESGGGFSTNAITLGGEEPDYYLDYSHFTNTPDLADVAISGSYDDLTDKPTIPTLDGVVKTTGDQSIEGKKTFKNETEFGSGSQTWTITDSSNSLLFTNGSVITLPKTSTPKTIAFTDIIPSTSTEDKILLSTGTAGVSKWSNWDSIGFLKTNASGVVSIDENTYSLSNHSHDDKYYTKSEINNSLNLKLNTSLKGVNNGLAELDETGKVPSEQLPSYVDDVLEYNSLANFPIEGEGGKIYIAKDTNLTYRWGGSIYVLISSALALGTTSSTAYRGDRGKIAYDHSQTLHAPSDAEANQTLYSGVGMDFPNTDGDVTIAMGTPSNISISTENNVSGTTHTHKLVLPQDIQTTANPRFAGVELGSGTTTTWTIDDDAENTLTFKNGANTRLRIKEDGLYVNNSETPLGEGSVTSVSLATGTNNGTLKLTVDNVSTDNIAVKGLGSAAYTASSDYATSTHGHGSITTSGTITTDTAKASGFKFVMTDGSGAVKRSNIALGSSTTTFLSNAGTWITPAGTYSLPLAANGTRGGVQIGYTANGRNYPVQLSSEKMFVNVPWTDDTNTTYSIKASTQTGGAGLDLDAGGSGSGTDTVKFVGSGATTVAYTDANTITISSTDNNTVYTHPNYSLGQSAGTETTLTDITLIDSLTTNPTGHLTGATWRKLVAGSNITISPAANGNITIAGIGNTYPTAFAWSNGTTSGPTGSLTGTSSTVSFGAIPKATDEQSGVVTTGAQTFSGLKSFNDNIALGNGNPTWTITDEDTIDPGNLIFKKDSNYMAIKSDGVYFNGTKLGSGAVTSITGTSPIAVSSGTTPEISVEEGYTIPSDNQIATWNSLQTNATHTGDVIGSGALTIQNNVVTNSKLAYMSNSTIKGRVATGSGDPEDLTPAEVRAMLNVADGANNYTHPTGGANTTITAANGKVLSGIVVNDLGHVTSISSKTLNQADIPNLSISKIIELQDKLDQKSSLNHTHETAIAADSGASQLSLSPNTKYKLTAGGTSYIFTTPTDNNTTYTFATGTANGTFRVTPSGGTLQSISIYGLKSAAYEETSSFRSSSWVPSWAQVSDKPSFAPVDAQKNSDITKAEIEAKLVGEITSHTHSQYLTSFTETDPTVPAWAKTAAPSAVRFMKMNANNTITWQTAANFRSDIGAGTSNFSGNYNDLSNKPSIPAAQVQSNWNATTGMGAILNKPNLATVATSGNYNDLSNIPTIPTVYNSTLTITAGNGLTTGGTFTTNQSSSTAVTVALGTPSDITTSSTNSVSSTSHTHKLVLPQSIATTATPTFAGLNVGSGTTTTWTIDDTTTTGKLTFKLGSAIIKLDGSNSGETKTIAFTDNISPTINVWGSETHNNIASALLVYESLQKNYPEIIDLTGGS